MGDGAPVTRDDDLLIRLNLVQQFAQASFRVRYIYGDHDPSNMTRNLDMLAVPAATASSRSNENRRE